MAKTTLVLISVCALVVGACGPANTNGDGAGDSSEVIIVDTGQGIAAFETASGNIRWDAPQTLPSPSFDRFFSVDDSSLVTLDPESGRERAEMEVPPGLTAGVASFKGGAVALTEQATRHPFIGRPSATRRGSLSPAPAMGVTGPTASTATSSRRPSLPTNGSSS
jgi:hypothetical protein